MNRGIKHISQKELQDLAAKAEAHVREKAKICRYCDLAPVFDQFLDNDRPFSECFEFLVNEGIVLREKEKSLQNAFARYNAKRK